MSQKSEVSGVVQIEGVPVNRIVRAFAYSETIHTIDGETVTLSKSLGHASSDPETGAYTIDLMNGYGGEVFVVAFDDYGKEFVADLAVNVGDRVHPTEPNGYVFQCESAGTLPTEEPDWIIDTESPRNYGSASMLAFPFYRPMSKGPIKPEVTLATPSPLYLAGAGFNHSAVVQPDGTIAVWGDDYWGQISDFPTGLSDVVAVVCGGYFTAALKSDGTIVAWGGTSGGESTPPANGVYTQIAGGHYDGIALRDDGIVETWGKNGVSVPSIVNDTGAVFVEGWGSLFLAVLSDGSLVRFGSGPSVPAGLPPVAFAGAGRDHAYAILEDRSVEGFGANDYGQINTPTGFGDCRQIAGGRWHTVALTHGGALSVWGRDAYGLYSFPGGSDFIAVCSGAYHCIAVREDGTVEAWGDNGDDKATVPSGVTAKVPG